MQRATEFTATISRRTTNRKHTRVKADRSGNFVSLALTMMYLYSYMECKNIFNTVLIHIKVFNSE